jgi:hypothetical protein
MARNSLAWLCLALLLFASIDDLIAAETESPDDDVVAAADNDYVPSESPGSKSRARNQDQVTSDNLPSAVPSAGLLTRGDLFGSPVIGPALPNQLYSLMSLQR